RRGRDPARGSVQGKARARLVALRGFHGADEDDGRGRHRAALGKVVTVLVTGANGFVGRWVVRALLAAGHTVVGASGPESARTAALEGAEHRQVTWMPLDLLDQASVRTVAAGRYDAVIHLAGLASGGDAM